MSSLPRRLILVALVTFVLAPATAHAAGVAPGSDLSSPSGAPFPTDRYTVADATQLTGVRVEPAQAQLRRPAVGLPRHRRAQHARRLQPPAAALDPLHGRDRRGERLERERLPRPALRRCRDRDQPDRLGASGEHAPRRVGPAARPAHALLARRHERSQGRRRRPDRGLLVPPGSELRPRQGRRRQGLPQGADRGAQSLAPRRRREGGRRHREPLHDAERDDAARAGAGADQGIDPGSGRLPDRHARRAHGVPALERARCPVHAADRHRPGLLQLVRCRRRALGVSRERRHDRLRLLSARPTTRPRRR